MEADEAMELVDKKGYFRSILALLKVPQRNSNSAQFIEYSTASSLLYSNGFMADRVVSLRKIDGSLLEASIAASSRRE